MGVTSLCSEKGWFFARILRNNKKLIFFPQSAFRKKLWCFLQHWIEERKMASLSIKNFYLQQTLTVINLPKFEIYNHCDRFRADTGIMWKEMQCSNNITSPGLVFWCVAGKSNRSLSTRQIGNSWESNSFTLSWSGCRLRNCFLLSDHSLQYPNRIRCNFFLFRLFPTLLNPIFSFLKFISMGLYQRKLILLDCLSSIFWLFVPSHFSFFMKLYVIT